MNSKQKLFLKAFLFNGISFGILMTLLEYLWGYKIILHVQIIKAAIFGTVLSLTGVIIQIRAIRRLVNGKIKEEDLEVTQSFTFSMEHDLKKIYNQLTTTKPTNSWNLKIDNSIITGRTNGSWYAKGDKITITSMIDEIEIKSNPIARFIYFDNGRNKKNVLMIKDIIKN